MNKRTTLEDYIKDLIDFKKISNDDLFEFDILNDYEQETLLKLLIEDCKEDVVDLLTQYINKKIESVRQDLDFEKQWEIIEDRYDEIVEKRLSKFA